MAKLVLSKSGLQKQRENMRLYERVLPSLELKRMQLTAELKRAQEQLDPFKGGCGKAQAGGGPTVAHAGGWGNGPCEPG